MKINRALLSVSNKEGLIEFARGLEKHNVEIIASGGTEKELKKAKIKVTPVEKVTGFPECLDGRVKTLHPKIHAAILADRGNKKHMAQLKKLKIKPIDLVCVNFYPFAQTIAKPGVKPEDAIESIDIGGPAMVRGAAKNHGGVAVVTAPKQYAAIVAEMNEHDGKIKIQLRRKLANAAFQLTAGYDSAVSNWLHTQNEFATEKFPRTLSLSFDKISDLRYGENPHQEAAFYRTPVDAEVSVANTEKLHGKELSFNNINDTAAALSIVQEFAEPCCAIVKHTNPCGVALDKKISVAFGKALDCDRESAFGGIIALNRECDLATAKQITAFFNEVVIAPSYEKAALEELKTKKHLRVLSAGDLQGAKKSTGAKIARNVHKLEIKDIPGGLLVQERDAFALHEDDLQFPTRARPTDSQMESLLFAWKVVKHVKSNAIVLAKGTQCVGLGVGQTSRIQAVKIAVKHATVDASGGVMASDGFFPFADSVERAADAGVGAIIQPGGSVKDAEVIKACDDRNIPMVFTRTRHFRH